MIISRPSVFVMAVLCILSAWAVFPPSAASYNREMVEGTDTGLFWPDMPVNFAINSKCSGGTADGGVDTDACITAVTQSFNTWAGPSCTYLRFNAPEITNTTDTKNDDGLNLVVWHFDTWNYSAAALAMTTTTYMVPSGEIVDADMEVNGKIYQWRILSQKGGAYMDIQNTVTHEAGHVIGLDHSGVKTAVMYPSAVPGEISKRTLAQDDIDGVCAIYPTGSQPDGGSSPDGGGGGGGGCNIVELSP
jgi:hypothetical protein